MLNNVQFKIAAEREEKNERDLSWLPGKLETFDRFYSNVHGILRCNVHFMLLDLSPSLTHNAVGCKKFNIPRKGVAAGKKKEKNMIQVLKYTARENKTAHCFSDTK